MTKVGGETGSESAGSERLRALAGRVVTMNDASAVHDDGIVYLRGDTIEAVLDRGAPAPAGFDGVGPVDTGGTIFPGLIELHNHLSYNILRLWEVPRQFTNRDQWAQGDEYRKLVTGPMKVLAHTPRCVPAVVRYVEAKCLVGGTTSSQGISLSSYAGIMHFYRGVVRNVEQTDDPDLPEALTHIADVEANDRDKFLARLQDSSCLLLHLSEGTDEAAREHFLALHGGGRRWAITPALAGIHCVALDRRDFAALAEHGGSMVWSPLSNLLLYGATADIKAAREAGVTIALGPDWSPSGSKNVLGELKIARAASAAAGDVFSDQELVALATRNAAAILKWDKKLGSLEAGKYADLIVVEGDDGDSYECLLRAGEQQISLVMIGGSPRYGHSKLMTSLLAKGARRSESAEVAGGRRLLNLHDPGADPEVAKIGLGEAVSTLEDALKRLPQLAKELERESLLDRIGAAPRAGESALFLVLDHDELAGVDLRPHLPGPDGEPTAELRLEAAGTPLPDLLVPLELDPLTAADDELFAETLAKEQNLPTDLKSELAGLFA